MKPSLQGDIRQLGGLEYVPLGKLCGAYNLDCKLDDIARTATIQKGQSRIIIRSGSRLILVDGSKKKLDRAVVMDSGTVFVPVSFVGAKIAQRIVQKIPQDKFRKVVAVFLLAAGLYLFFV